MGVNINSAQKLPLKVAFNDDKGKPANLNGNPSWSVDKAELGALVATTDPLAVVFVPADDAVGTAVVTCTGDSDLHGGPRQEVSATIEITIAAPPAPPPPEATAGEITAGDPAAKS